MKEAFENKIVDPEDLPDVVDSLRLQSKSVATLNGSFDLLHAGHLEILFEAAKQAEVFIVALNSDKSIQQYKSADRPIIPLEYRLKMMAAISCVDHVTWFDELDPRKILETIQPTVHVNGAEYGSECIEAPTVEAGGGRIHLVNLVPGLSTTNIIEKIKNLCD